MRGMAILHGGKGGSEDTVSLDSISQEVRGKSKMETFAPSMSLQPFEGGPGHIRPELLRLFLSVTQPVPGHICSS